MKMMLLNWGKVSVNMRMMMSIKNADDNAKAKGRMMRMMRSKRPPMMMMTI